MYCTCVSMICVCVTTGTTVCVEDRGKLDSSVESVLSFL